MYIFKPLEKSDIPLMYEWLGQEYMMRAWDTRQSFEAVEKEYLDLIHDEDVFPFIILYNNKPFGYIQAYDVSKERFLSHLNYPRGSWGIDTFIGDQRELGKGHGPRFLGAFIQKLHREKDATCIVVDPKPYNECAIRAYKKAGFVERVEVNSPEGNVLIMEKMLKIMQKKKQKKHKNKHMITDTRNRMKK